MLFSERMGIKKPKAMQVDEMDYELRMRLRNVYKIFLDSFSSAEFWFELPLKNRVFIQKLWSEFFNWKIEFETLSDPKSELLSYIEEAEWYSVLDFFESSFIIAAEMYQEINLHKLEERVNQVFEVENYNYRMSNLKFIPVTNPEELRVIENTEELTRKFTALKGANEHLNLAVNHFAERKNPDFKNSIKESISSVESALKVLLGKPNGALGELLNELNKTVLLPQYIIDSMHKLYAYTNDKKYGIRHGKGVVGEQGDSEIHAPAYEDAKYMLVTCSAFINYLVEKFRKAGILPDN